MAEEGYRVTLNIYDLSQGLARQLSTTFLGKPIEAIWHTGILVYGNEYYFGGGIQHSPAGSTPYGTPIRVVELGVTHLPQDVFESYLEEISPRYTAETYSLLTHNCNNFSNEVAQFLVGTSIPNYILELPNEVMSSPMGVLIMPMIQQLESTLRANAVPQAPQFRPSAVGQAILPATLNVNPCKSSGTFPKASESKYVSEEQSIKKGEVNKTDLSQKTSDKAVPPAVEPVGAQENPAVPGDPLGNARTKVQEEIAREFAALMASGTLRASEAAALATRKVMQRYGNTSVALS